MRTATIEGAQYYVEVQRVGPEEDRMARRYRLTQPRPRNVVVFTSRATGRSSQIVIGEWVNPTDLTDERLAELLHQARAQSSNQQGGQIAG